MIPRIVSNLRPAWKRKQFWLGLGNLISSITMTLFYVTLAYVMDSYKPGVMSHAIQLAIIILALVRIGLCAFPANNWFDEGGNQRWRLYRNLPFIAIGMVTAAYLVVLYRQWLLAMLVVVSFVCYNGREEESKAGHDDDPKDDMLYMDDSIFPVVCENKKTDR